MTTDEITHYTPIRTLRSDLPECLARPECWPRHRPLQPAELGVIRRLAKEVETRRDPWEAVFRVVDGTLIAFTSVAGHKGRVYPQPFPCQTAFGASLDVLIAGAGSRLQRLQARVGTPEFEALRSGRMIVAIERMGKVESACEYALRASLEADAAWSECIDFVVGCASSPPLLDVPEAHAIVATWSSAFRDYASPDWDIRMGWTMSLMAHTPGLVERCEAVKRSVPVRGAERPVIYRSRSALALFRTETVRATTAFPQWFEFERTVGRLMERRGFQVEHRTPRSDGGIDLLCVQSGETWFVQCKCWAPHRPVGPEVIRELVGSIQHHMPGAKGMVATTSRFTAEALAVAADCGVVCLGGEALAGALLDG